MLTDIGIALAIGSLLMLEALAARRGTQAVRTARKGGSTGLAVAPAEKAENGPGLPFAPAAQPAPRPSVSVVIPALNEERCIGWVLRRIPAWVSEVVLVDGLSTDHTEALARSLRPDLVVVHQRQAGKGAALRAGFAAATGDLIVMIDADGSTDPAEMHRFVEALEDGADFVKGSRYMDGGGSSDFTTLRSAGNRALVALANLLYRSRFTDLCYGYCAFRRSHLEALALTATGFEIETQLVLNAAKAGLDMREVPSFELCRRAGASNLHAYRDGRRVLATMLREWRRRPVPAPPPPARIVLQPATVPMLPAPEQHEDERRRADRRQRAAARLLHRERRAAERRRENEHAGLIYLAFEEQIEQQAAAIRRRHWAFGR